MVDVLKDTKVSENLEKFKNRLTTEAIVVRDAIKKNEVYRQAKLLKK